MLAIIYVPHTLQIPCKKTVRPECTNQEVLILVRENYLQLIHTITILGTIKIANLRYPLRMGP